MEKRKIVFLDRDGTICTDYGAYQAKINDYQKDVMNKVEIIDGVKEGLKTLKEKGYLLIVITNQAGVAKGKLKEADIHKFNLKINNLLDNMIDGFYYCVHHSTGLDDGQTVNAKKRPYLIGVCGCRKPKTGMLIRCNNDLKEGHIQYIDNEIIKNNIEYVRDRVIFKKDIEPCEIDVEKSYMVGDKYIDLQCGKNYNLKSIWVKTGEFEKDFKKYHEAKEGIDYDYIASDMRDVANFIINN